MSASTSMYAALYRHDIPPLLNHSFYGSSNIVELVFPPVLLIKEYLMCRLSSSGTDVYFPIMVRHQKIKHILVGVLRRKSHELCKLSSGWLHPMALLADR